ncbi:hypothetical protein FF011L_22700 [Roseimaritima multifibrata]|uniref:RNA polymerase sigma factor n=1 Tax=Roseimaritima multifibrata TaxID=1930274 RepID=A0A517MF36_9BACT|nr:sigma-70 family RNA polymerase sigma factor [Roseimaritima multifibrata]QDS93500.1 hypothetical protein FF011L_22700 [Roseimaritima multifibrata]
MFLENTESTMMSVLFGVASVHKESRRDSLERFCLTYTNPLVRFLVVTKKVSSEDADEIVQEFWLVKLLEPPPEQNLISKYLAAKDANSELSFRRYLSKSLSFYFINRYRSADARHARNNIAIEALEGWEPEQLAAEQFEFDTEWANHLLNRVLKDVRSECVANGHRAKWDVFVELVLVPGMRQVPAPSYAELAEKLGIQSPKAVGNAWITVKRMILRHFQAAVLDYLPSSSAEQSVIDAEHETQQVLVSLAARGGLRILLEEETERSSSLSQTASFALGGPVTADMFRDPSDLEAAWQSVLVTKVGDLTSDLKLADTDARFGEWLSTMCPPLDVLDSVRRLAKKQGKQSALPFSEQDCFPREIWALIYLLVLAIAQTKHGRYLSNTKPESLKRRMVPFRDADWIDDESRRILSCFIDTHNL